MNAVDRALNAIGKANDIANDIRELSLAILNLEKQLKTAQESVHLLSTIALNANNTKLTDAEFRLFVQRSVTP